MKRAWVAVCLIVVASAFAWGGSGGVEEGLKKTALDYAEGWYNGDAERMERALHPDLAKRVLMPDPRSGKGRVEQMSAMTLVQYARAGGGKSTPADQRKAEVKVLDVYGNAACVRLDMQDWIDYLQMSRIGGEWKIVNVLWELTPESKQKRGISEDL
jgi:hypothetical protein